MTDRSLIVSTGPRGRVERLLRGEIHADDLHELFFSMREESWPAPGSEDTELGVLMGPEVRHGEAKVYARVQA